MVCRGDVLPGGRIATLAGLLVAALLSPDAGADSCVRETRAVGRSPDGRFVVTVAWVSSSLRKGAGHWTFLSHDTQTNETTHGRVNGFQRHAHPKVLVTPGGETFAVFDPTAGHRHTDRLPIYARDGKLIKSLGLDDLLKPGELVERSVSHLLWMGYDPNRKRGWWLEKDGRTLSLLTKSRRLVQVSLTNAKVLAPKAAEEAGR